ncbi:hypothetical protein [Elizabethkingia meningoseptica]|uniref:hypothetical protein n=1 Tax=Elizabethkingia meningoseptica TaxID=238 RepID=UPI000841F487|nr:hypothetical protein [Elizabethkingia meningoseptica]MEC4710685.1 hypothetical protein [Elizabethkingia meningoseptica]ODM50964.1 hypothetical protein BES09_17795 [Elizabethkingia meningoseptica]OHT26183.1 hypothetical protein BFF93_17775 [Elizabethkingia meningoseptica]OPB93625.1 hypothetical protein BAS10_13325 [Elizabethkingia meningoseptica]OPC06652.1 hypothetical protein BAX93_17720 [Elizabethkingia meningoseptica]
MRKRQIIVPLTEEALIRLESDSPNEIDQIIYNISEEDESILYNLNIYNLITQIYPDIIIDDFEEENINDETKLRRILELIKSIKNMPRLLHTRLVFLFDQAILCKTGIYFYF